MDWQPRTGKRKRSKCRQRRRWRDDIRVYAETTWTRTARNRQDSRNDIRFSSSVTLASSSSSSCVNLRTSGLLRLASDMRLISARSSLSFSRIWNSVPFMTVDRRLDLRTDNQNRTKDLRRGIIILPWCNKTIVARCDLGSMGFVHPWVKTGHSASPLVPFSPSGVQNAMGPVTASNNCILLIPLYKL